MNAPAGFICACRRGTADQAPETTDRIQVRSPFSIGGHQPLRAVAVALGDEPPIEADGGRRSEDDHRRISFHWLAGTVLTGLSGAALSEVLYRHGAEAVRDRAMIDAAMGADPAGLRPVLAAAAEWTRPVLPVGGNDALAAGFTGPDIGAALEAVEADWIASDFTLTREQLLRRLKRPD